MLDHGNHDHNSQHAATTQLARSLPPKRKDFLAPHKDPMIGRFLQRDPLGYVVGPSLYEHVGSRPTLLRDPHGLEGEGAPLPEGDSGHTLPDLVGIVHEEASEMLDVIDGLSDSGFTDLLNYATFAAIADYAMDLPNKYEGDGYSASMDSDQGDALRHCMWQCELSKAFGADVAEKIGDIHEKWGMRRAAAQRQEKGRDGRTPVEREKMRSDMDEMNNFLGRECAGQPRCEDCCLRKLSVGRLLSAVGGDLGTTGPGHLCNPRRRPRRLPWPLDRWWLGGPPIITGWLL